MTTTPAAVAEPAAPTEPTPPLASPPPRKCAFHPQADAVSVCTFCVEKPALCAACDTRHRRSDHTVEPLSTSSQPGPVAAVSGVVASPPSLPNDVGRPSPPVTTADAYDTYGVVRVAVPPADSTATTTPPHTVVTTPPSAASSTPGTRLASFVPMQVRTGDVDAGPRPQLPPSHLSPSHPPPSHLPQFTPFSVPHADVAPSTAPASVGVGARLQPLTDTYGLAATATIAPAWAFGGVSHGAQPPPPPPAPAPLTVPAVPAPAPAPPRVSESEMRARESEMRARERAAKDAITAVKQEEEALVKRTAETNTQADATDRVSIVLSPVAVTLRGRGGVGCGPDGLTCCCWWLAVELRRRRLCQLTPASRVGVGGCGLRFVYRSTPK